MITLSHMKSDNMPDRWNCLLIEIKSHEFQIFIILITDECIPKLNAEVSGTNQGESVHYEHVCSIILLSNLVATYHLYLISVSRKHVFREPAAVVHVGGGLNISMLETITGDSS